MADYIFLMHQDITEPSNDDWEPYLAWLQQQGCFLGGSAIGAGVSVKKTGSPLPLNQQLTGFIRVEADNLEHAKKFLIGNPVYDAGGTVEIRELPSD